MTQPVIVFVAGQVEWHVASRRLTHKWNLTPGDAADLLFRSQFTDAASIAHNGIIFECVCNDENPDALKYDITAEVER